MRFIICCLILAVVAAMANAKPTDEKKLVSLLDVDGQKHENEGEGRIARAKGSKILKGRNYNAGYAVTTIVGPPVYGGYGGYGTYPVYSGYGGNVQYPSTVGSYGGAPTSYGGYGSVPISTGGYGGVPISTGGYGGVPVSTGGYGGVPISTGGYGGVPTGTYGR